MATIRERQIRAILRFHLTPIRMTSSKTNNKDNRCWWECRGEAHLHTASVYVGQLQALWESTWSFFKSLKQSKSTLWFISSSPGIYQKDSKSICHKESAHVFLHLCLQQLREGARAGTLHQWQDEESAIHIHDNILFNCKAWTGAGEMASC